MPGRLLPMWLADKFSSPLEVMVPVNCLCGILAFVLLATRSSASIYVFAVLYGLFGAGLIGLFPACLSNFSTNLDTTGSQIGWGFTIASFAVLIGPPISGLLVNEAEHEYWRAQIFAACCLVAGCIGLVGVKLIQGRRHKRARKGFSERKKPSTSTILMRILSEPSSVLVAF